MTADTLYPPTPTAVPAELTRTDSAYRLRVVAMIGGLFLFLILYLAVIALAGWIAYLLLAIPLPSSGGRGIIVFLVLKFGGALAAGLLCLFLVKGLFKRHRVERSGYIPLREADHPQLFAFVRRVYTDVGAPPPRRVYVSPDVNAALVYDTSLVNLVIPPRKDLLIGLGLVNVVELAEFKAVLAHEFGHFAQRSVGLGSYLYVANRVMHDVIYSRDALDQFVDQWAAIDLRISFPAWGLKGVLWVVRGGLSGAYRGLNLMHLSLSRQMEYNADNVAVSLAGSDALIHGLARLEFASECLADASRSLDAAADHGLFTDDLYYHQSRSADRIRRLRQNERLGLPPELPDDPTQQVKVFEPIDDGIPDKYRSHPADHMREANAKRFYIRSQQDTRSPWLLFGDAARLRQEATEFFYQQALSRREAYTPRPAAEVQAFIDAEHAETTYDPKYHGWYDDRFVNPGEVNSVAAAPWSREDVTVWLTGWPAADLGDRVGAYRQRQSELQLLNGLKSGDLKPKGKTFPFREQQCGLRDVDRLLNQVDEELKADHTAFDELDRQIFLAHSSAARHLDQETGGSREAELLERYRFHAALQGLLRGIFGEQARLQSILQFLSSNPQLNEEDFGQIRQSLRDVHTALTTNLEDARAYRTPALTNVPAGSSLHDLIMDRGDIRLPRLTGETISGEWLGKLLTRLNGVLERVKRLHFKSLGGLLAQQEKLAAEWFAASTSGLDK